VGTTAITTAIRIARDFRANVTAVDIAPLMLERAADNVKRAGLSEKVAVEHGDICNLRFTAGSFDRVVAEAVTMFVDRSRAARELVRVCKPGGRVLATEFYWRKPPTPEARHLFLGEVCPGLQFDSLEDWVRLYTDAGLADVQVETGPFNMMTPAGFLHDEGLLNSAAVMGRAVSRLSYMRKMAWLMPRVARAVPYLGFILVSGTKPPAGAEPQA
jgi:SAM-dependent methyltransferase